MRLPPPLVRKTLTYAAFGAIGAQTINAQRKNFTPKKHPLAEAADLLDTIECRRLQSEKDNHTQPSQLSFPKPKSFRR